MLLVPELLSCICSVLAARIGPARSAVRRDAEARRPQRYILEEEAGGRDQMPNPAAILANYRQCTHRFAADEHSLLIVAAQLTTRVHARAQRVNHDTIRDK